MKISNVQLIQRFTDVKIQVLRNPSIDWIEECNSNGVVYVIILSEEENWYLAGCGKVLFS